MLDHRIPRNRANLQQARIHLLLLAVDLHACNLDSELQNSAGTHHFQLRLELHVQHKVQSFRNTDRSESAYKASCLPDLFLA